MHARTTISLLEACGISLLCFGWAVYFSLLTVFPAWSATWSVTLLADKGFANADLWRLLILEVVCASLALYILHRRKYAINSLLPQANISGFLAGWLLFLLCAGFSMLISHILHLTPAQETIGQVMAPTRVALSLVLLTAVVNGLYEEVFLLGVLQRGLRRYGVLLAISTPLLLRLAYHLYQGRSGIVLVLGFGLILAVYYWHKNQLYPPVFAHILADISPYLNHTY